MIRSLDGISPRVHPTAFVSEFAYVIGDVEIGEGSSVWPGTVIRADMGRITIGKYTCVQDNSVVHGDADVVIGDYVVIGHRVMCHAKMIGNRVLIGNGATINDGVAIGEDSLIASGAMVVPGRWWWAFPPASGARWSSATLTSSSTTATFTSTRPSGTSARGTWNSYQPSALIAERGSGVRCRVTSARGPSCSSGPGSGPGRSWPRPPASAWPW